MKPDTSKIPLDKLKPDHDRPFNVQECMGEGGIAVTRRGNRLRVVAEDHPKGQDSQVLSYELQSCQEAECLFVFNTDGTSQLSQYVGERRAFHPILFGDKGQPLWLLEPPNIEGHELDRVEEVEVTPELLGRKGMNRAWCGNVWCPPVAVRGAKSTYLASYRKVEPEITFDEKGFPSFMAEPPGEEGYECFKVCKGSAVKFFPHDAHHVQAGEPDCPHWLPGILERKATGGYPNHYYALYRKVAPKLKANGIPAGMPDPPEVEGYSWEVTEEPLSAGDLFKCYKRTHRKNPFPTGGPAVWSKKWEQDNEKCIYVRYLPLPKEEVHHEVLVNRKDLDQLIEARKLVEQLLDNSESESGAKATQMLVDYKAKYRQS